MSQTRAVALIQQALARNATRLNLSKLELTELPPEIGQLTELRVLWLQGNKLENLPPEIGQLTKLRRLRLQENRLTALPPEIGQLTELQDLSVYSNELTTLPPEIGRLHKLQRLITAANNIQRLPDEIGNLTGLRELNLGDQVRKRKRWGRRLGKGNQLGELPPAIAQLQNLQYLYLDNNQLGELPPAIAQLQNLQTLWLHNNQLGELPPAIAQLQNLQTLSLNNNQLGELPPAIAQLQNLQYLYLDNNQLSELPPAIAQLQNLQTLSLSNNQLGELPPAIAQLQNLQYLYLDNNQLSELPPDIAQLQNLQYLYLDNNQLSELPPDIAQLQNLQYLYLDNNQLSELPPAIAQLQNLQTLSLNNNQLGELPPAIAQLQNLQTLWLHNNQLGELPPAIAQLQNLQTLSLSNNQLGELPRNFERLEKLWLLSLDGNPLGYPPLAVANQGMHAIREYLTQEANPLWVSKMMVVGQGRVGKSSLLALLRKEPFKPDRDSTHGMILGELELPHPTEPDQMMQLNTWDFGGQEHYHAPHQFFLTDRALYLIVWNAGQNYEQGGVLYWLDTVTARAPKAKILVVATHRDQREPDIPFADLKKRYPQIVGPLFAVSCKVEGDGEALRQAIADAAVDTEMMGRRWPDAWRKAADALQRKAKKTKYLSPAQLKPLLSRNGVKDSSQQTLTRWLHQLGEILHYDENEYLKDIVMLDPEWVTKIVSRVLDSQEVKDNHAILTRAQMEKLWHEIEPNVREHLVRLMDEFDLSYKVEDGFKAKTTDRDQSLVVELLKLDEADYHAAWNAMAKERNISMKLELDRIPPAGIPTWFIARQHRHTTKTHWRLGALFADTPENPRHLALVKASPTEQTVTLTVRGPNPINFFAKLSDGLLDTFRQFPGLKYKRKVPCKCREGCTYEFDYDTLDRALNREPVRKYLPCGVSLDDVSVPELIYGHRFHDDNPYLKEISARLQHIEGAVDEQRIYEQREFTKLTNALKKYEEDPCPYVFALRSGGGDGNLIGLLEPLRSPGMWDKMREAVFKTKVELQLYCQHPGEWHPVGCERGKDDPETGLYQIEIDSDFLQTVGPYLIRLAKAMKFVLPVVGYPMPWIVDDEQYLKQFKEDLDRWTKFADSAAKSLPELFTETQESKLGRGFDPHRMKIAEGYELRALRALLKEKDKKGRWGKLNKCDSKLGYWLWLCPHHYAEYRD